MTGEVVKLVADRPLQEVANNFDSVQAGPRALAWRADAPATLAWVEALDGGDPQAGRDKRDARHDAGRAVRRAAAHAHRPRFRGWRRDLGAPDLAFVDRELAPDAQDAHVGDQPSDPSQPPPQVVGALVARTATATPGRFESLAPNQLRPPVLLDDVRRQVRLPRRTGRVGGGRPAVPRPLRARDRQDRASLPLRGAVLRGRGRAARPRRGTVLTRRESGRPRRPNYCARDAAEALGAAPAHASQGPGAAVRRRDEAAHDVQAQGRRGSSRRRSTCRPGYDKAHDGPLPFFLWAYPLEFKDAERGVAGRGLAVPLHAAERRQPPVPAVAGLRRDGRPDHADHRRRRRRVERHLRRAARRRARRRRSTRSSRWASPTASASRVGGHSYGAFMTANLLSHTNIFRAGIARSGAYNRTLTPFGFQARGAQLLEGAGDLHGDVAVHLRRQGEGRHPADPRHGRRQPRHVPRSRASAITPR